MDHSNHGGGPYPNVNRVEQIVTITSKHSIKDGAARTLVSWNGAWGGKRRQIALSVHLSNWPDSYPDDDLVVNRIEEPDRQYVHADGAAVGLTVENGREKTLRIPWHQIIRRLVRSGHFDRPSDWGSAVTRALYFGHETKNNQAAGSAMADAYFTDFRIESATSSPSGRAG